MRHDAPAVHERTLSELAQHALAAGASGAVLAVREDAATAVGTAGEGMNTSTRFRFGSIGKTFVAALVLGLVDEGRLELDAPLALYLPNAVANADAIRIRHLLQHTSGLRDFLQEESFLTFALSQPDRPLEPAAVLELVAGDPLFPPGAAWAYASTNYLVLSLVVEAVAQVPLREALRARLAEPLGLTETELPPLAGPPAAAGDMPPNNPLLPEQTDPTPLIRTLAYGADALVSTPSDVTRFLEALLGGELLRPASAAELLRAVPADGVEFEAYGLGIGKLSSLLGVAPSPCGSAWGHLGLGLGHTTVALSRRDASRQAVLAVNQGLLPPAAWAPLGDVVWRTFCG